MAAARGGISLIWKIVLVVELLGRSNGIGYKLNEFFNLFDIASLFAYTLSFVTVMIIVEYSIISPIERRLNKWRTSIIKKPHDLFVNIISKGYEDKNQNTYNNAIKDMEFIVP